MRPLGGTVNDRLPNEIAFALPCLGIVKRMLLRRPGVATNANVNALRAFSVALPVRPLSAGTMAGPPPPAEPPLPPPPLPPVGPPDPPVSPPPGPPPPAALVAQLGASVSMLQPWSI